MKLLYVTSQSGRRINGFMRSAIIAARQLNIDFTIVGNMDHADKQLYEEDCRTYGIKAEHIDCDRNPLAKKNYTLAKKQLLDLMKRENTMWFIAILRLVVCWEESVQKKLKFHM